MKIQTKMTINELFTSVFFILVTLMYSFENTYIEIPNLLHDTMLYTAILLAFVSILHSKYNIKDLILICMVCLLSLLVYISSHESIYLVMILAGLVMRNVDYRSVFKKIFWVRLFLYICIICLAIIGILPIGEMSIPKGVWGITTGFGLGYEHPNNLAQNFFMIVALYICIRKDRLNHINFGIVILLDLIMYLVSKSKTSCILVFLLCIITWIFLYGKRTGVWTKKIISIISIPILFCGGLIGIVIPYLYANLSGTIEKFFYLLNGRMNGRLSNATILFSTLNLTWFGKIIDQDLLAQKYSYSIVDNGYAFALFDFGVVGFIVIFILYFLTIRRLKEKREYIYLIVVLAFCIMALFENILRAMFVNFAVIFWNEAFTLTQNRQLKKVYKFNQ